MQSPLKGLSDALREQEAKTQKLGTKAALAHLKAGTTSGVDIMGEPPALYLDALVQGAVDGLTATVQTRDETLPKWLFDRGARVFVVPSAKDNHWAIIAEQENGVVKVRLGETEDEERTWKPKVDQVASAHVPNLRDFAPYDSVSVASSLEALPPKKRAALKRRLAQSSQAFLWQVTLLMTLSLVVPVVGIVAVAASLGLFLWQLSRPDPAFLVPFLVSSLGMFSILGARIITTKLDHKLGITPKASRTKGDS